MLTDWEPQDAIPSRKIETIARSGQLLLLRPSGMLAYIAVLGDRIVFSLSSKSWKASGLRTFLTSTVVSPLY